jgi:aspartate beta-hydroxylase
MAELSATPAETADSLRLSADRAAAGGDLKGARALLERAAALAPARVDLWMGLAACCRGLGDLAAAAAAVEGALRADPRNFMALLMKGSLLDRAGQTRAAAHAYGVALTQAPPDERIDPTTRAAVARAREAHAAHTAGLEAALKDAARRALGSRQTGDLRRADIFAERVAGRRRVYHQEPVQFYYPGVPEIEFWERDEFPWLEALEAATADIREELVAILRDDADTLAPYVNYPDGVPLDQWAELNRSIRWGAFHLYFDGREVAWNAKRAPKTMAALAGVPLPALPGRSPAAMFSVLQPKTRIPPHTGIANVRLVVHLPLVVPPGCGFRVGAETREWGEGEAWVFDDTIEHEAWNDSDEPRTILICDTWNPRLSEDERQTVAAVMAAMDEFNQTPASGGAL